MCALCARTIHGQEGGALNTIHPLWLPIVLLIVALWLPACAHEPEGNDPVILDAPRSDEAEE